MYTKTRNMIVTVIGLGLIGGSIALDLKESGFATQIIGIDANMGHQEEAIKLGIADYTCGVDEALAKSDLVLVAVPVDTIKRILPQVLDKIGENTTVADVGSTKQTICEVVEGHPKRGNYVPTHPMSGTENSGPRAAHKGLFKEKITIICDQEKSRPQHLALVEKMFQSLGMSIAYMTADEQDHSTAFISHLPHVTAFALANAVLAKENRQIIFDLASGGFRSTVRLAKSSEKMWGPIFKQNKQYVVESIEVYQKHLNELKEAIAAEESDRMMELIANATRIREVLDKKNPFLVKSEEKIVRLFTR